MYYFCRYGTRFSGDKSGAYLFLPGADGTILKNDNIHPIISVIEGPVLSTVTVQYPHIQHTVLMSQNNNKYNQLNINQNTLSRFPCTQAPVETV